MRVCAFLEEVVMKIASFAALGLLILAAPAFAHHPFASEFDASAPVNLTGKVTKVDWKEPHVVFHVAVADPGGQIRDWSLKAASPAMLERKGWTKATLKEGDQVTVRGYRAKSQPFMGTARSVELPGGKKMPTADDGDGGPKV
jgi:Family of unknown function (DUF6152)